MYDSLEIGRVLVVCPLRVADTWMSEIGKWDEFSCLKCAAAVGTPKERLAALHSDANIVVINRENTAWAADVILAEDLPFDMLVLDELQSFKSYKSKRSRAVMKIRSRFHRIVGLTGTPSSNGLMDLFGEYKVLDGGKRLGRFITQYRLKYFEPDKRNGQVIYSYKPLPGAEDAIYEAIDDITISMKSTDYLPMPELITSEYTVRLSDEEKETYDRFRRDLVLSLPDGEVTAANAAALTGKLVQSANGAVYSDDEEVIRIHDRKLDGLEDIIESMNGRPLLVAYWFKHDLTRIRERLDKLKVGYEVLKSPESIESWNAGKLTVGLLHPASLGLGVNLQSGGNTLLWFSLTWSLELYQQTNARLWRQGQESGTVVIEHLVTEGTIDRQILFVLSGKEETQNLLIDAVKASLEVKDGSV